ncbi:hypothetical protein KZX46_04370 [Polymorphobacter sp. PAMC 29334]|uniref:hypothetical protein n=1 Tax=Polymorphobacter sp. PAMC 29334 TaxID=2862331 RepID=UPI001C7764E7|nr:hypothetical protein [Polymorphobacter sp. PAMC 29334]QYE35242.1 hypothetical protein KZX46_04370 [Polymorphobacter sp. PAMC 29334]
MLLFTDPSNLPPEESARAIASFRDQLAASAFEWTGIEERVASDPEIMERIMTSLKEVNVLIEKTGLNNAEKAKAHSINNALMSLIDSPEPEWKVILNLLSTPAYSSFFGVSGFVIGIIGLLK